METDSAGLFRIAGFLARQGVTAWLPTLVPAPVEQYEQAVRAIEQAAAQTSVSDDNAGDYVLAQVLGVHYEGPFVNSEQCGALHREHFRTFKRIADLDSLPAIDSERAIHLMTLAPETEGGIDLIKELNRRGWIVSIGHTRALVPVLDQALAAGARHMTHFMNAMTPLHHRAPGPVGWGLVNDEVTCDVIADGIHLDASILKLILRAKGAERISLISDAIAATGQGDGEYQIWGEQISVKNGRTSNSRGSIAGSVITMLDAVRMMLSLGLTEPEVARMASSNPARLLRLDNDRGSIEVGKRADLVALDSNLNVRATIVGGRVVNY
jgi:N-acetylglucosamine-6-phosphate deacetylase